MERLALQPLLAWALAELGDLARAEALLAETLDRAASRQLRRIQVDTLRVGALVALRQHQHAKAPVCQAHHRYTDHCGRFQP